MSVADIELKRGKLPEFRISLGPSKAGEKSLYRISVANADAHADLKGIKIAVEKSNAGFSVADAPEFLAAGEEKEILLEADVPFGMETMAGARLKITGTFLNLEMPDFLEG